MAERSYSKWLSREEPALTRERFLLAYVVRFSAGYLAFVAFVGLYSRAHGELILFTVFLS
jgi:hypothetical protein